MLADIEQDGHEGKRHRSAAQQGFFYARIGSKHHSTNQTTRPTHPSQPHVSTAKVPVVRSTLADEDDGTNSNLTQNALPEKLFNDNSQLHHLKSNESFRKKEGLRPQAFRLARPASSNALRPGVTNSGIHKQRKKRKGEIPLFIEKTMLLMGAKVARQNPDNSERPSREEPREAPVSVENERRPPQKRPIVTAAEKERRSRNWANVQANRNLKEEEGGKPRPVQKLIPLECDPVDLAAQLSEFALIEAQKLQRAPQPPEKEVPRGKPPKANLKFPPKGPPDRSRKHHMDTVMTDVGNDVEVVIEDIEDQDYVYETFVRRPIALDPRGLDAHDGFNPGIDVETSGLLVIESEDEELWQEYGEDDDSEREFPSDEDDENGEWSFLARYAAYVSSHSNGISSRGLLRQ